MRQGNEQPRVARAGFRIVLIVAVALCAACSSAVGGMSLMGARSPAVEILWDRYEVPHIYGRTQADVFYGFGWAQARNVGSTLLRISFSSA